MEVVVLSLGTNSGDRVLNMRRMEAELLNILDPPIRFSSLMETAHVGGGERPVYYNRLIRGRYAGSPSDLLHQCQAIELDLGRRREERFAPRTADIDILLFGNEEVAEKNLCIPHPRMLDRCFCIAGLAEIAGELTMPRFTETIGEAAAKLLHRAGPQTIAFVGGAEGALPRKPPDRRWKQR
jgi:2-amino-4-hydroxy-6-hydroxymethyldihydropteridine diphosphokinase